MNNKTVNAREAPIGYRAVLKSEVVGLGGLTNSANICNHCDWRPTCQKSDTDFSNPNHKCMSYETISQSTGEIIYRRDGCSVVFKKLEAIEHG
jgi:hypothetical protein